MYLLGIDIGTSSTKSAVFDLNGNIVGLASKSYTFESVKPGYAEQDPEVWWDATKQSVHKALEKSHLKKKDIVAVGLSGQMHGIVPLDSNGRVIRKAILHCDVRAAEEVDEIKEIFGAQYESAVYNPIFPGFQAVSLYWLRKHEPENFVKIYKVVCPKDYVRYRLTGTIGTEHTDASGTLLYDMKNSCWSKEVFQKLEIDPGIVPDIIANSYDIAGKVKADAADETGLAKGTPVAYGGADQAMQSTGNGIYQSGITMATIGTSGQVLTISRYPVFNEKVNTHTFRHVKDGTWYGLGAVLFAGSTLNWFQRNFCENMNFEQLSEMAEDIEPCSNGLVFFPCMGGERTPYLDPKIQGMFLGATMVHNRAHYARAIMEGVTFEMKTSIDTIQKLYGVTDKLICAGGGVKGSVWAQIQADIYGQDIWVSKIKEQACLGAAIMAGIAAGIFADLSDACTCMCDQNMIHVLPNKEHEQRYHNFYQEVYKKIYDCNADLLHTIDNLIRR